MDDKGALLSLLAAAGLGYVIQWALVAPHKVPTWVAWVVMGASTILLYWWATPTVMKDFAENWRYAVLGMISFFLTAKGTGAAAAATNAAPRADTL